MGVCGTVGGKDNLKTVYAHCFMTEKDSGLNLFVLAIEKGIRNAISKRKKTEPFPHFASIL